MLAFKLGGKASLAPLPPLEEPVLNPPASTASVAAIHHGEAVYQRFCSACHGDVAVSGGLLPDLRYSTALEGEQWFKIVRDGAYQSMGMVAFGKEVSQQAAADIRAYVIFRANQSMTEGKAAKAAGDAEKSNPHK
jgi:alcohol dehydrogenase (cytochrome c)/quinohemoprotein ethanol dehydrogenase